MPRPSSNPLEGSRDALLKHGKSRASEGREPSTLGVVLDEDDDGVGVGVIKSDPG